MENEAPTEEHGPNMTPEDAEKMRAAVAAKMQRKFTEALKTGMIEALHKVSSQIAHSTNLDFKALRATSIQKNTEGQDLVIVVDVLPSVFHDGPVNVGG